MSTTAASASASAKAKEKLAIGRRLVLNRWPYINTALYSMAPVEVAGLMEQAGCGMAITHSLVLLYDPDVVATQWDNEDVATGLAHEIGHTMRDHFGRAERYGVKVSSSDTKLWNYSGDRLINDDLQDSGFKLLSTDVTSATLNMQKGQFRTIEETFAELKKRNTNAPKRCCGSGSGHALPNEQSVLPPSHPAHRSPCDVDRTRRHTAQAIKDAAKQPGGRETIPGGWLTWADLILAPPKVSWREKLTRKARRVISNRIGEVDYCYGGMSHLQGGVGYGPGKPILPVMRGAEPTVVVALDTSGSMGKKETERAVSESDAIIKASGSKIKFISSDYAVHKVVEVRNVRELIASIRGGGGTSFKPVFEEVARWKTKPDLLIYCTDGMGDAPVLPPSYPVIWLLVGSYRQKPHFGDWNVQGEPWGTFIEVSDET